MKVLSVLISFFAGHTFGMVMPDIKQTKESDAVTFWSSSSSSLTSEETLKVGGGGVISTTYYKDAGCKSKRGGPPGVLKNP